jgi:hypothetical protein
VADLPDIHCVRKMLISHTPLQRESRSYGEVVAQRDLTKYYGANPEDKTRGARSPLLEGTFKRSVVHDDDVIALELHDDRTAEKFDR